MCGPPPVCGPAPMCGPPPCAPVCKENPLAKIFKGAWSIVTGTVALPLRPARLPGGKMQTSVRSSPDVRTPHGLCAAYVPAPHVSSAYVRSSGMPSRDDGIRDGSRSPHGLRVRCSSQKCPLRKQEGISGEVFCRTGRSTFRRLLVRESLKETHKGTVIRPFFYVHARPSDRIRENVF